MTDKMNRSIKCIRKLSNDRKTSRKTGVNSFIRFDPATQELKSLEGKRKSAMNMEMNEDMKLAMGVSDAMLDHVMFCKQEDSNWPLQNESTKVNTVFEGIFRMNDSNEACMKIEKIIKLQNDDLDKSIEKKEQLHVIKLEAENKEHTFNELKRQHEEVLSNVVENHKDLEAIKTLLNPLENLNKTFNVLENEKAEVNGK